MNVNRVTSTRLTCSAVYPNRVVTHCCCTRGGVVPTVSLEKIRKVAPNGKEVLNNINLGMYLVSHARGVRFTKPCRDAWFM